MVNVADSTDVDVRLGSFESFLSHFFLLIGLLLLGYSFFSYFKPDITPVSHLTVPPSGLPECRNRSSSFMRHSTYATPLSSGSGLFPSPKSGFRRR
ncbi:MAG: hypothetical protein IJV93_10510 [Lentisphaeria bacterium]|nr:hypothetical protein [Lentisphaeria bacterium]